MTALRVASCDRARIIELSGTVVSPASERSSGSGWRSRFVTTFRAMLPGSTWIGKVGRFMCASSADESTSDRECDARAKKHDDLIRRVGEQQLEQLLKLQTAKVQLPPEAIELQAWLYDDRVEGKFTPWWHQRIDSARGWGIEVPPVWKALASLFDRLFPGTCNVFNELDPRPHVTEDELFPYLNEFHGLSVEAAKALSVVALTQLLQTDWEQRGTVVSSDTDHADEKQRDPATGNGGKLKGVSLQDAASRIRNGDPGGQGTLVKAWRNSRNPKLPIPIGSCPSHSQRNLYEPAALLAFLKKTEGERVDKDFGLSAYFRRISRLPKR